MKRPDPSADTRGRRSFREIRFRLEQELANLWMLARPPKASADVAAPLAGLPDPEAVARRLRGSTYEAELLRLADSICSHCIPLLGFGAYPCGERIRWRRDDPNGIESGLAYFRRVPYLDFAQVGDHKFIWELNRHQHLVVLAQAWRLSRDARYVDEIRKQLADWNEENPFQRGINWTSALEVAFRALSWMWIYHLAGEAFDQAFRRWLVEGVFCHGRYLEENLSVYFSPNTHLVGEAVALHALGVTFAALPGSSRWRETGSRVAAREMERQVREDGSHFEQSTYYHVYALDFFLLHAVLNPDVTPAYRNRLARMVEFLGSLVPQSGRLPFIGDDDGGRVFHPYGDRSRFALGTLAACAEYFGRAERLRDDGARAEIAAWWFGESGLMSGAENAVARDPGTAHSRIDEVSGRSGLCVMRSDDAHVVMDAGGFGGGSAGHSHADTLSVVVSHGNEELLIDAGTFTYVHDPVWRECFRGVAAHNTVQIDGLEQAAAAGPFRWVDPPEVNLIERAEDRVDAVCRYRGFTHRRVCLFRKPDWLIIVDRVEGPPGEHEVVSRWHCGVPATMVGARCAAVGKRARLVLSSEAVIEEGWRSRVFGAKEPTPVVTVRWKGTLPGILATVLAFARAPDGVQVEGGVVKVGGIPVDWN